MEKTIIEVLIFILRWIINQEGNFDPYHRTGMTRDEQEADMLLKQIMQYEKEI